jgi:hypothetical protein
LIETVRKGAEGLKDEQVTFLNTSVQALQSFVGVLAESTATTSPAITTRKQIQEELDGALQHLQSIIFSAKSLLLAAGECLLASDQGWMTWCHVSALTR